MTELRNRRASFDYEILETFEAGLVLTGSEVKSLREGGASIAESFGRIRGGEVFVEGMNIPVYRQASYNNHDPLRTRKLLLNRREIRELRAGIEQRGLSIVPLKLYFKDGYAKLLIGLGRGRKRHDKRQKEAEKDARRQMEQARKGSLYSVIAGLLLVLGFAMPANAQDLVIGGQNLGRYRTDLVPGVTYGPAGSMAEAFGASLALNGSSVSLALGGRTLVLPYVPPGATGPVAGDAITADGSVWLPVKAVSQAFAAHVTLLSGNSSDVVVTLPSASMTGFNVRSGTVQLDVSAPVPWSAHYIAPLRTLVITLERTAVRNVPAEAHAGGITRAWAVPQADALEVRIQLEPDSDWDVTAVPSGSGFQLTVTVAGAAAAAAPALPQTSGQVQLVTASGAEHRLAVALADALRASGIQASVQPAGVAFQAGAAVAVHLQLDPLATSPAVHYLGDLLDPAHEAMFSRLSGGADLALARRSVLLSDRAPAGEAFAAQLAQAVGAGTAVPLPLPGLLAAGGRAVLLILPEATAQGSIGAVHDVLVQRLGDVH